MIIILQKEFKMTNQDLRLAWEKFIIAEIINHPSACFYFANLFGIFSGTNPFDYSKFKELLDPNWRKSPICDNRFSPFIWFIHKWQGRFLTTFYAKELSLLGETIDCLIGKFNTDDTFLSALEPSENLNLFETYTFKVSIYKMPTVVTTIGITLDEILLLGRDNEIIFRVKLTTLIATPYYRALLSLYWYCLIYTEVKRIQKYL